MSKELNSEEVTQWVLKRACNTGKCSFTSERDTGMSSNALVWFAFTGEEPEINGWNLCYPSDPSDLRACMNCFDGAPKSVQTQMVPLLRKYVAHIEGEWAERSPDLREALPGWKDKLAATT